MFRLSIGRTVYWTMKNNGFNLSETTKKEWNLLPLIDKFADNMGRGYTCIDCSVNFTELKGRHARCEKCLDENIEKDQKLIRA